MLSGQGPPGVLWAALEHPVQESVGHLKSLAGPAPCPELCLLIWRAGLPSHLPFLLQGSSWGGEGLLGKGTLCACLILAGL